MLSPHAAPDCRSAAGTCKCATARNVEAPALTVLIGDGRSDFCAAGTVDMVFAKDALRDFCRAEAIPHVAFEGFSELPDLLADYTASVVPIEWRGGRFVREGLMERAATSVAL